MNDEEVIYLDNAATSWPKPPEVAQAMASFLETSAGNPGRSGHRLSIAAGRVVYETRETIAGLFGLADPLRVVFTANVTEALNLAIRGLVRPGDHVVTSGMEHNAVMRPLRALEREGVDVQVVRCNPDGSLHPGEVEAAIRPHTRLVVVNHASNVAGTIQPLAEIGAATRKHGTLFMVDAAQTAGILPVRMDSQNIDLLAFTGHKGLLGPSGTGGLLVGERVPLDEMQPLVRGGTGSRSESEEQPEFLPDRFESGTPNAVGLAGLLAGIQFISSRGMEAIRSHEQALTRQLIEGLLKIPGVRVFGPCDAHKQVAVVSCSIPGMRVSEAGFRLDEEHGILCRPGLHCSPAAHRTLATFPEGTLRLAPGPFTKKNEIDTTLQAIRELAMEAVKAVV